jgi:RNA polymerase sigma-70 factor (ECF subfamily)
MSTLPGSISDDAMAETSVHSPAALWRRFQPSVERTLTRALGSGAHVDDLVQEVFMRLFRNLPSLREPSALPGFVHAITSRVIMSELRGRWSRRWLALPGDDGREDPVDPGADTDAREALGRLERIAGRLPDAERSVFLLRCVAQLELVRVAEVVGVSLATVKRWLGRIGPEMIESVRLDPLLGEYFRAGRPRASLAARRPHRRPMSLPEAA